MLAISAQLYTVRDLTAVDMPAALQQVSKIGYRAVELAGFGSLKTAAEMRRGLDDAGLSVSGAHVSIDRIETEAEAVFDEQAILGNRIVIVPWLPENRRQDSAGWKQVGSVLSAAAGRAARHGLQLAYHNHDFEFKPVAVGSGMDALWSASGAGVKAEIDVYWVAFAGLDPVAYLHRMKGRLLTVHLKDMEAGSERRFAPVGDGILDFKAIVAAASEAGALYGVVEQDACYEMTPLESLLRSFTYLNRLLDPGR